MVVECHISITLVKRCQADPSPLLLKDEFEAISRIIKCDRGCEANRGCSHHQLRKKPVQFFLCVRAKSWMYPGRLDHGAPPRRQPSKTRDGI